MQSGQEGLSDSSSDQSFMNGVIISMTLSKGVNVGTCTQQRRRGDSHHVGNHCTTHIYRVVRCIEPRRTLLQRDRSNPK